MDTLVWSTPMCWESPCSASKTTGIYERSVEFGCAPQLAIKAFSKKQNPQIYRLWTMHQHLPTKMHPQKKNFIFLPMTRTPRSLPDGTTAIHFAAERGDEELASFLATGIASLRKTPESRPYCWFVSSLGISPSTAPNHWVSATSEVLFCNAVWPWFEQSSLINILKRATIPGVLWYGRGAGCGTWGGGWIPLTHVSQVAESTRNVCQLFFPNVIAVFFGW